LFFNAAFVVNEKSVSALLGRLGEVIQRAGNIKQGLEEGSPGREGDLDRRHKMCKDWEKVAGFP
jgi:hypothetical protein